MWANVKEENKTETMSYIYKGIVLAFLLFIAVMDCHAQLPEKGDYRSRVGIKAPKQVQSLMSAVFERAPYKDPFAPLDSAWYMDFYEKFKKLTDYAPYADYAFYSGAFSETQTYIDQNKKAQFVPDGTSIYERLIEAMPDTAMKMVVVEDILALGRKFIDNLDSVNVVRNNRDATVKAADDTLSLPVAMTKYAHLYYKYAGNPKYYPAHLYDKVQARENYRKAFRMLVDNNIEPGDELHPVYLNEFYKTCEDLFKSNEDKYYNQFLQDYLDVVHTCDNILLPYYDGLGDIAIEQSNPDYQNFSNFYYYTNDPVGGVKSLFDASGAHSMERVSEYYLSMLPTHRTDQDYLEKALYVMNELGCNKTEAFYSYSEASNAIDSTYLNCLGCAFSSKEYGMLTDMHGFYVQAAKEAPDSLHKGLVYYHISDGINVRPVPTDEKGVRMSPESPEFQAWVEEMSTAVHNINMLMELSDFFENSPILSYRVYPIISAQKFYDIQRALARGKRDPDILDEAMKYMRYYPSKFNLDVAQNQLQSDRKYIKDRQPKAKKSSGTGPRMKKSDHEMLRKCFDYAYARLFMLMPGTVPSGEDKQVLDQYEGWYNVYKSSPDLTPQEKDKWLQYNNLKKSKNIK